MGEALLDHCAENCNELLQTAHGGDLVACLAGDSSVGNMLWDADPGSVKRLQEAIAAAAVGSVPDAEGKPVCLLEHFFASRALKRIAGAKGGDACRNCALTLWNNALRRDVGQHVGTHAAKVLAALVQGHPDVAGAVRACLQQVMDDVDSWLRNFRAKSNRGSVM